MRAKGLGTGRAGGAAGTGVVIERRLDIDGRSLPVTVRLDRRARRIAVRVDPSRGVILVTSPPRAGVERALGFAASQGDWILRRLARVPDAVPFDDGAIVPLEGRDLVIRHQPDRRGAVWVDGDTLQVAGAEAHVARRVRDWLKEQGRRRLSERAAVHAATIGARIQRVQVRDTVSRWGSCSATGVLSFSWRLILAPPFVLDYVAAHEVCHLRHMDHSSRFWDLCAGLVGDCDRPRTWLKVYGARLHRYGQSA